MCIYVLQCEIPVLETLCVDLSRTGQYASGISEYLEYRQLCLINPTVANEDMGKSHSKRKDNNSNSTINNTSKPILITPPRPFLTLEEFFETWFEWKEKFLKYKTINNYGHKQWKTVLLNFMGPVAQDIYSTFTFQSPHEKENVHITLQKFDEYCIFKTKKRLPREDVYEYINELQSLIEEKKLENGKEIIKQKILMEIDKTEFTNTAKIIIPTFEFSVDYKNLTLMETAFIWKQYVFNEKRNCIKCGNEHIANSCPAVNKQCIYCNELGHYNRRCPKNFIFNCAYCGDSHFKKRCPAFKETCSKCQKPKHFFWKCQVGKVLNCRYCGLSHQFSRKQCPAQNTLCSNCKQIGHYTAKCNNKLLVKEQ